MKIKNKDVLILRNLAGYKRTVNETIEAIRRFDFVNGIYQDNVHYYTHLNKLFAPLERANLIVQVGSKKSKSKRTEKVWALTQRAEALLQRIQIGVEVKQAA